MGHFFAEMDSRKLGGILNGRSEGFNWATSSQKWIAHKGSDQARGAVFQLGHFFAEMDRKGVYYIPSKPELVSIGPLLRRNG